MKKDDEFFSIRFDCTELLTNKKSFVKKTTKSRGKANMKKHEKTMKTKNITANKKNYENQ